VEARHQCYLYTRYINKRDYHLTNDLSRGKAEVFLFKVTGASPHSSPVSYSFSTKYVEDPFPLTKQTLYFFASYFAKEKLAPQTIKGYPSALHNAQISLGLPDPREQSSLPLLKRICAWIGRTTLQRGIAQPKIRLPIMI